MHAHLGFPFHAPDNCTHPAPTRSPKFKWHHLTERVAYENATRAKKQEAEDSQVRKETNVYMMNVANAKGCVRKQTNKRRTMHRMQTLRHHHDTTRLRCAASVQCSSAPPPPPPPASTTTTTTTTSCLRPLRSLSFRHTAANKRPPNHNGLQGSSNARPEGGKEPSCQQEKGSNPVCAATAADQRGRVEGASGEGRPGGQRGGCCVGSALRRVAAGWARVTRTLIKMQ